jgi:hypothetical protein
MSAPVISTTGSFMSVLLELDLMVKLNELIATAAPIANVMIHGILEIEDVPFLQRLLKCRLGTGVLTI